MAKSKSGRAHAITRMKQARNSSIRILEYLQELDQYQNKEHPVLEAGIPVAVSIAVSLNAVIEKMLKAL